MPVSKITLRNGDTRWLCSVSASKTHKKYTKRHLTKAAASADERRVLDKRLAEMPAIPDTTGIVRVPGWGYNTNYVDVDPGRVNDMV